MIELNEEQRRELKQGGPIYALDPQTNEKYVLVRAELFDRLESLFREDWSNEVYNTAMAVFAREGWDNPRMDVYDELDPRRQS
jgi:hypothetical protein